MIKKKTEPKSKVCHFCVNGLKDVDYKDANILRKFISSYGKIAPRRRSYLCASHQRKTAQAIKRARFMALMPYTTR